MPLHPSPTPRHAAAGRLTQVLLDRDTNTLTAALSLAAEKYLDNAKRLRAEILPGITVDPNRASQTAKALELAEIFERQAADARGLADRIIGAAAVELVILDGDEQPIPAAHNGTEGELISEGTRPPEPVGARYEPTSSVLGRPGGAPGDNYRDHVCGPMPSIDAHA